MLECLFGEAEVLHRARVFNQVDGVGKATLPQTELGEGGEERSGLDYNLPRARLQAHDPSTVLTLPNSL